MVDLPLFLKVEAKLYENMASILEKQGYVDKQILLISGSTTWEIYGKTVHTQLSEARYKVDVKIISKNQLSTAIKLARCIIEKEIDLVLGIGGGRVLDVAKYSAYITKKPFFAIPTALSHDGTVSPISVLTMRDGSTKSLGSKVPDGVLVDLDIIKNAPRRLMSSGICDVASNYTALFDWKLAEIRGKETVHDFSYMLSSLAFRAIFNYDNPCITDEAYLSALCEAIALSGMAMSIAGSSRPCSGSEHLFSHAIDRYLDKPSLHGHQVGLGAIICAVFQKQDEKKLIAYFKKLGIDVSPKALGLTLDEFILCIEKGPLTRKNRYTILNETHYDAATLERLYHSINQSFEQ